MWALVAVRDLRCMIYGGYDTAIRIDPWRSSTVYFSLALLTLLISIIIFSPVCISH